MKTIPKRFLQDSEWYQVEELVMEFITPLLSIDSIDTKDTATQIKANILANRKSYDALIGFCRSSGIIRSSELKENKENIFK